MMINLLIIILSVLFPTLACATSGVNSSTLSLAPPPSDMSVVFLGNIFGIVDGVLHGSGSQIMGNMFGVFNSAVLALGGFFVMYTLIVATMNTAQEGQLLGQKWSSLWIPLRTTLGLALLIPKATGYCLMQIFVMWIVVQGVGAADQVWAAALNYLNQGGAIILPQNASITNGTSAGAAAAAVANLSGGTSTAAAASQIANGATAILAGQVCMLGLQTILENTRQSYLTYAKLQAGPCHGTPTPAMNQFCQNPVPDFISTVNAVVAQQNASTGGVSPNESIPLPMPNFESGSPYSVLNGVCGTIQWAYYQTDSLGVPSASSPSSDVSKIDAWAKEHTDEASMRRAQEQSTCSVNLNSDTLTGAQYSRSIAVQQMYTDLSIVAQAIVSNAPFLNVTQNQINTSSGFLPIPVTPTNTTNAYSYPYAQSQFGVPYTTSGSPCANNSENCQMWGPESSGQEPPIFNGTEFQGAIADYNGLMLPTLTLANESSNCLNFQAARSFISTSNAQGWILAGSYFFNLARLNAAAMNNRQLIDSDSDLGESVVFSTSGLLASFGSGPCPFPDKSSLCTWMNNNSAPLSQLSNLITGSGISSTGALAAPKYPTQAVSYGNLFPQQGLVSSTVFGYIDNSFVLQGPGQPGLSKPIFPNHVNLNVKPQSMDMQPMKFPPMMCISFIHTCVGTDLADLFVNVLFRNLFNAVINMIEPIFNTILTTLIKLPLEALGAIFLKGVGYIEQPNVNPIIALSNMGTDYINFAGNMWIDAIGIMVVDTMVTMNGYIGAGSTMSIFALVVPIFVAWLGIMMGIGFITAYYIPFLPYMIFTFGAIAWLMAVVEAMVAAPIVALGVIHPEGHDTFGKGEPAIMILLNVFLRPAMMIIGYIAAIALSYVSVWLINAGFNNVSVYILGPEHTSSSLASAISPNKGFYTGWAQVYGFFFCIFIYTSMYLTAVQKSFTLIVHLPDRVLRWIGGTPESYGSEAASWGEDMKGKLEQGGGKMSDAQAQIGEKAIGKGQEIGAQLKKTGTPVQMNPTEAKKDSGGGKEGGGEAKKEDDGKKED